MKIFVPGRLCLFGEHSDWAGKYRPINPALAKGYAVIVGTNQGIHAVIRPHPDSLVFKATLNNGDRAVPIHLPMHPPTLLAEAKIGGFASYVAGAAYQMLTRYGVAGLEVDNYLTDLPIQKGLSSSAAICVLIARAFNQLYQLQLTVREEMELAYLGERTTPSQCGRMDQGCAYGGQPILMTFDGDRVDLQTVTVKQPIHLVIVNLGGRKDTQQILRDLNRAYPFAETPIHQQVQQYLGAINRQMIQAAITALEQGSAERLGALMTETQADFDRLMTPACSDQLAAPKLHQLLSHPALQPYIYGGKGVGSQGDGSAQLVAKNRESQAEAISLIHRNFPEMYALALTIGASERLERGKAD